MGEVSQKSEDVQGFGHSIASSFGANCLLQSLHPVVKDAIVLLCQNGPHDFAKNFVHRASLTFCECLEHVVAEAFLEMCGAE
jgi:hypothetical protein